MTLADLFRIAGTVLLVIAAILSFGWIGDTTVPQVLGLGFAELACWCISTLGAANRTVG